MALYQNKLPSRLILSNQHAVNPAGTKDFQGNVTDTVEISDADLELPGIKHMLAQDPPALVLYKAPTVAEVKAAQAAATAPTTAATGDAKPADLGITKPADKAADKAADKTTDKTADKK